MDYKLILLKLLEIENEILESYEYDKDKALEEHVGYKKLYALSTEITELVKKEEEEEIIQNSFLLL